MANKIDEIREIARKLMEEETVERVIGYGKADFTEEMTPVFITSPEEVEKLLFNEKSNMMLAKYLLNYKDSKTGIVAKPCDTRAIASYLSEDMLKRDNVVIIGINDCPGMTDNTACNECEVRNPVLSDYTVGEEGEVPELKLDKTLEEMSTAERKEYFVDQFSRCMRCYACRQACYVCYCEECFVDSNQPRWVGQGTNPEDNFTYHLMRAMHMAGRCINCGACEVACPEDIDVRALTAHLSRYAEEIYNFKSGMDPQAKTLLSDYNPDDSQPGFID